MKLSNFTTAPAEMLENHRLNVNVPDFFRLIGRDKHYALPGVELLYQHKRIIVDRQSLTIEKRSPHEEYTYIKLELETNKDEDIVGIKKITNPDIKYTMRGDEVIRNANPEDARLVIFNDDVEIREKGKVTLKQLLVEMISTL